MIGDVIRFELENSKPAPETLPIPRIGVIPDLAKKISDEMEATMLPPPLPKKMFSDDKYTCCERFKIENPPIYSYCGYCGTHLGIVHVK